MSVQGSVYDLPAKHRQHTVGPTYTFTRYNSTCVYMLSNCAIRVRSVNKADLSGSFSYVRFARFKFPPSESRRRLAVRPRSVVRTTCQPPTVDGVDLELCVHVWTAPCWLYTKVPPSQCGRHFRRGLHAAALSHLAVARSVGGPPAASDTSPAGRRARPGPRDARRKTGWDPNFRLWIL